MRLLYPLGLLGLIAIPLLIIIYIIKNKYTEQLVTSTYIWNLSERFLKRKNPINKITGIISLILQIVAVIAISVAIAHPVFTLPGAANDYYFILDGSGSMNITVNGKSRFETAKDEIGEVIAQSVDGSTYTLVLAGDTTDIIYEELADRDRALSLLSDVSSAYVNSGFSDALGAAQEYFDKNPGVKNYLVTDKSYDMVRNAELINVSSKENNYALSQVEYAIKSNKLSITGKAFSYENDATVTVNLYIDDSETVSDSVRLDLKKLEGTDYSFESDSVNFRTFRIAIAESDALSLDNEVIVYNEHTDTSFRTLIVSETPFFMQAALNALGAMETDTALPDDYSASESGGYGLYVFDGFSPAVMPRDGAVWFVNPLSSTENSGFSVQGDQITKIGKIEYSESSATRVRALLEGVIGSDVYITKYSQCGLYRNFTTAASIEGSPLIFAGTNAYGNRQVVFAFDFHASDFAMSPDYAILMHNLLSFTFPQIVDESSYYCGETAQINVLANCDSIRIDTPLGNIEYLDTSNEICEYELREVGVYTITLMIANTPRAVNVYSALPESERFTTVSDVSFIINGEAGGNTRDGLYDNLIIIFILLAVVIIADWMVYCYEQYQLR